MTPQRQCAPAPTPARSSSASFRGTGSAAGIVGTVTSGMGRATNRGSNGLGEDGLAGEPEFGALGVGEGVDDDVGAAQVAMSQARRPWSRNRTMVLRRPGPGKRRS